MGGGGGGMASGREAGAGWAGGCEGVEGQARACRAPGGPGGAGSMLPVATGHGGKEGEGGRARGEGGWAGGKQGLRGGGREEGREWREWREWASESRAACCCNRLRIRGRHGTLRLVCGCVWGGGGVWCGTGGGGGGGPVRAGRRAECGPGSAPRATRVGASPPRALGRRPPPLAPFSESPAPS